MKPYLLDGNEPGATIVISVKADTASHFLKEEMNKKPEQRQVHSLATADGGSLNHYVIMSINMIRREAGYNEIIATMRRVLL